LNNLAALLSSSGRLEEAATLLEAARAINEQAHGPTHAVRFTSQLNPLLLLYALVCPPSRRQNTSA